MKTCGQCTNEFSPSSRHKLCPKCRSFNNRRLCQCGKLIYKTSNLCSECVLRSGNLNANWKGGRVKHKAGYVMRLCPDHPRSSNNNGYVFEHILVMEEFLNRYLIPGENVHHKNGVKDDNQIENLELWAKPQPSGARAKDLYLWAKSIVELYEPDISKL
jgi:hypothetical protein